MAETAVGLGAESFDEVRKHQIPTSCLSDISTASGDAELLCASLKRAQSCHTDHLDPTSVCAGMRQNRSGGSNIGARG